MENISDAELSIVRNKLNDGNIKLWLYPFTETGRETGVYPDSMLQTFSESLGLSKSAVECALEQLRKHALNKLASRNSLTAVKRSDLINVHIKLIGHGIEPKMNDIQLDLNICETVKALKEQISASIGCDKSSHIKIIYKGKILSDETKLISLDIRSGSTLLIMRSDGDLCLREEEQLKCLQQTKEDAELLSAVEDPASSHCLQVADQEGRSLDLPIAERKALAIALALHEKGKSALKKKNYDNALLFFLEADSEFKHCTSEILSKVDNYALLNLDIVWCYLCLGSISELPDAEQRLLKCERCFKESYGTNLERLNAVKGGSDEESALMARFHLLQGIASYQMGKFQEAEFFLEIVQGELDSLKVDDEKIAQILSFGYTTAEARLALRSSRGNVESAVYKILKKREERMRIKRQEEEKYKGEAKRIKLGKTIDGQWVEPTLYDQLLAMGFPSDAARQALQMSNNSVSLAVQLLHDQGTTLGSVDQGKVAQLVSMGFEQIDVEEALKSSRGDLLNAQEILVSGLGLDSVIPKAAEPKVYQKAVRRLAQDITEDHDDYLDLNMEEEENFLQEYLLLLKSKCK